MSANIDPLPDDEILTVALNLYKSDLDKGFKIRWATKKNDYIEDARNLHLLVASTRRSKNTKGSHAKTPR